jgi:hypothetical protein
MSPQQRRNDIGMPVPGRAVQRGQSTLVRDLEIVGQRNMEFDLLQVALLRRLVQGHRWPGSRPFFATGKKESSNYDR